MFRIKYILLLLSCASWAQNTFTVSGSLPTVFMKEVVLKSFTTSENQVLCKTTTNSKGDFSMSYSSKYIGAALLEIKDSKSVIVILNQENFSMQWNNLTDLGTLKFNISPENDAFTKGLNLYQTSEQKRAGLYYLLPYYKNEPEKLSFLQNELDEQNAVLQRYFESLPANSYTKYYLNLRRLIADMPLSASRYSERIEAHEQEINSMDFSNEKLIHSGLIQELLENYIVLLESYGDKSSVHYYKSIKTILKSLESQPVFKQDVAEFLFKTFEKRSLFAPAEQVALVMLDDNTCQIDDKRRALFEQYRKMAKGNIAPNIVFSNSKSKAKSLTEINAATKLVVFGASWCHKCTEDIPKLYSFYNKWKKRFSVEVVFVSLDTEKSKFDNFSKDFTWISTCDFNSWDGKTARDYYVFGTPSLFLLDQNNKILLKPISAEQIEAWMQLYGKQL